MPKLKRLTAEEERKILQDIWTSKNLDEQVFALLADRENRKRRLRGKMVTDLLDVESYEIVDRDRLKTALLLMLEDDHESVRARVVITCAFLNIPEAVAIILEQLEEGVKHGTAVSYLKALCAFQDPASEERVTNYAVELSSGDEAGAGTLIHHAIQVLGYLCLAKTTGEKRDIEELWYCLP